VSAQLHQHTQAAFLGGMDGSALIPYPVGLRREQSSNKTDGKKLLFWQDTFTGDGTKRTFPLTYRPLPYSERMFVDGFYRREGVGLYWRRDDGTSSAQVTFTLPPASGSRIIVEYAHYEQAQDPCGPQSGFPSTIFRGAPSYMYMEGRFADPPTMYEGWLPMAENFPYTPPPPNSSRDPYDPRESCIMEVTTRTYAEGSAATTAMTAAPGLAPGSPYARRIQAASENKASLIIVDMLRNYFTPRQPICHKATVVGTSFWYQVLNQTDYRGYPVYMFLEHLWKARGIDHDTWGSSPMFYWYGNGTDSGTWYLECNTEYPGFDWGGTTDTRIWTVPFPNPFTSPGKHFFSLQINVREQTMTVKYDDLVFKTEPSAHVSPPITLLEEIEESSWLPPEPWQVGDPDYDGGGRQLTSYVAVRDADAFILDEVRIFDDFPVCAWDDYSLGKK